MTTKMFIGTVRKYTRAKKLTAAMLNELIERIEVHQVEKINGTYVQRLTIHYACVGEIEIPDMPKLPDAEVQLQTRKGVTVRYSSAVQVN